VIKRDRANCIVEIKIVFVWRVVPLPSNNIIRTVLALAFVYFSNIFVPNCPLFLLILEPSGRKLEVSGVSQAVGSDWSKFRKR
jgi:hypothetical protein